MSRSRRERQVRLGLLLVVVAVAVGGRVLDERGAQPREQPAPTVTIAGADGLLDLPVPDDGRTWGGAVVRVVDGDTLVARVLDPGGTDLRRDEEVRVRLLRIDTPEAGRDGAPPECGADEATAALVRLLPVGTVATFHRDVEVVDRHGRQLAHAFAPDGTWVNGRLLAEGLATVVTFRPNVAHEQRVVGLEAAARDAGLGLWSAC